MRRIPTLFVLIIFTVLLMSGCYSRIQTDKEEQTEKEYFICVSIGKRQLVKDGFKLQSVYLVCDGIEKEPVLSIEISQIDNDYITGSYSLAGDVWAAALIRISKDSLPPGTRINGITMNCN